jgi:O-antigen/teichoic acid export membrane protein
VGPLAWCGGSALDVVPAAPAFGLLSVTGSWLVPWVFSAAWKPAVKPLRVLSALSVSGAVLSTTSAVLMTSGYANAFSRGAIGSSFAQVIIVLIVAHKGLMAVHA